jgi:hypothetical protein
LKVNYYEKRAVAGDGKTATEVAFEVRLPGGAFMKLKNEDFLDTQSAFRHFDRFRPFIYKVLSSGDMSQVFKTGDADGLLMVWLFKHMTRADCFQLMTLYTDVNGARTYGSRDACPSVGARSVPTWTARVPAELEPILHSPAGPDVVVVPFLIYDYAHIKACVNGLGQRLLSMTPLQVAGRCVFAGPEPGEHWMIEQKVMDQRIEIPALDNLAYEDYQNRQYSEALLLFEIAALLRQDCWLDNMVGATRMGLGDASGALSVYTAGVKRCPADMNLRVNRADSLVALGRIAEARVDVQVVLKAVPGGVPPGALVHARDLQQAFDGSSAGTDLPNVAPFATPR